MAQLGIGKAEPSTKCISIGLVANAHNNRNMGVFKAGFKGIEMMMMITNSP